MMKISYEDYEGEFDYFWKLALQYFDPNFS